MVGSNKSNGDPIEKQLWKATDKLRKNIDAAEYTGTDPEVNLDFNERFTILKNRV